MSRRSRRRSSLYQRNWRRAARAALVAEFGGFCGAGGVGGCGANGTTLLEFAHKVPLRRAVAGWSTDLTLRSVRANPFGFVLLCRPCHHSHDGPAWKGQVRYGFSAERDTSSDAASRVATMNGA